MIPTARAHLKVIARTHPGMTGKNNEDRFAVTSFTLGVDDPTPAVFAVLSDGIGGHRAGEVAAELAVDSITSTVAGSDGLQPAATLNRAVEQTSQRIYELSLTEEGKRGMGATCACVWVIGNHLYSVSVGDSRIYLVRNRRIRQLTTDHTWVQEAVEKGILTRDQIRLHPNAHVIRRYLGSQTPPKPDFRLRMDRNETDEQSQANQGVRLHPGDVLLLCSDGLHDLVRDDEIVSAFAGRAPEQAVDALIDLANQRGGYDNITLLFLQTPAQESLSVQKKIAWAGAGCAILALLALAAGLLLFILGWLPGKGRQDITPMPDMPLTVTITSLPLSTPQATLVLPPALRATDTPSITSWFRSP